MHEFKSWYREKLAMGKSEERNGSTIQAGESTFLTKTSSEASKMLEAALLQMDDIISGVCTESNNDGSAEWKDSVKEATKNLVTAIKNSPSPPSPPDADTTKILLQWMQPLDGVNIWMFISIIFYFVDDINKRTRLKHKFCYIKYT